MPWSIEHYKKYPFVANYSEFPGLTLESLLDVVFSSQEMVRKLQLLLESILHKGIVPIDIFADSEESVVAYYTLIALSKTFQDAKLSSRIALAYSKTAEAFLKNEDEEVLYLLGSKLGLSVRLEDNPPRIPLIRENSRKLGFVALKFSMLVEDYVRIAYKRLAHDPHYALPNQLIRNGYVYLGRQQYIRLLAEHIYNYVLRVLEELPHISHGKLEEFAKSIRESVLKGFYIVREEGVARTAKEPAAHVGEVIGAEVKPLEHLFPPCMKKIIDTINAGGNPSHLERFNLAAFLGQIGLSVEEILEYFKKTADYNEKIARYQVEHILGLRGSRKKYMPHNCSNLKAYGICPISEQCPGGNNPLAVYKYVVRKYARKAKAEARKGKGADEESRSSSEDIGKGSEAAGGI